ncbi:hypothetical protein PL9631_1420002 [Planktothrix paucivesiculata PCC 9631]|uniref:Uncharacterized protein n=1 Tax=Planktothrix paucivesiculata PCC 9631 TaxID=671071 RepID=A0A7Z9BPB2_9CYAN|nr:hypothetical protein PL9631_1420002 [Planktothrix paucivesiculata PCC 9631]
MVRRKNSNLFQLDGTDCQRSVAQMGKGQDLKGYGNNRVAGGKPN